MELHERLLAATATADARRARSVRRDQEPDPPRARQRARPASARRCGRDAARDARRRRDPRAAAARAAALAQRPRAARPRDQRRRLRLRAARAADRRPAISEIMVNGRTRSGSSATGFSRRPSSSSRDDAQLRRIINKMVGQVGRRIDESSPMVDARLPDGSRVNAIISPLSLSGPLLTIRRSRPTGSTLTSWSRSGRCRSSRATSSARASRPSSTSSSPAEPAPVRRRC